jgi:putative endonuclease
MSKTFSVYIMTNRYHTVLYTGVTNDIERRAEEHQRGMA